MRISDLSSDVCSSDLRISIMSGEDTMDLCHAEPAVHEPAILPFDHDDAFGLDAQLSDEERLVRDTAEAFAQERLQPRVTSAFLEERFDREIMSELGEQIGRAHV